jgi:hypothetical protein
MLKALAMLASLQSTSPAMSAGFLPEEKDVRFQVIERQPGEGDWPFLADKGRLACVPSFGMRIVLFYPWAEGEDAVDGFAIDEPQRQGVVVSTDPLQLWSDAAGKLLLQQNMTIEDKIRRMGPYVTLGKKLCDQPEWTNIGPSEL